MIKGSEDSVISRSQDPRISR